MLGSNSEEHEKLVRKEIDEIDNSNINHDDDVVFQEREYGQVATHHTSNYSAAGGPYRQRRRRRTRYHHIEGGGSNAASHHIKRGVIMMPIDMTIPERSSFPPSSSNTTNSISTPTYSMKQSRVSLYAAFPPPPPIINRGSTNNNSGQYENETMIKQAKKRLKQYSGFHGAVGTNSESFFGQGYSETMLSLNYRFPTLFSIPSLRHNSNNCFTRRNVDHYHQHLVGGLNYNILFGPMTYMSLGGTLSSLDGTTNVHVGVTHPFHDTDHVNPGLKGGEKRDILHLHPKRRGYTISMTRDFIAANPLRVHLITNITPSIWYNPYFNLTIIPYNQVMNEVTTSRPKVSFCAEYGQPFQSLWMSLPSSSSDCGVERDLVSGSNGGASVKLDVEQALSSSEACQCSIQYNHVGQALSLGTIFTRTFDSSKLTSVGVGIRHTFGNIFKYRDGGLTSWLFKIQRGETRMVVPITIYPTAETTWDSIIRLLYATMASIVVDTLVKELICNELSNLRLSFLKFVMGEESVKLYSQDIDSRYNAKRALENETRLLQLQMITNAREEALRQSALMKRQASNAMKREEQQAGLVIINAVYGVMDNDTGEFIDVNSTSKFHMMDATTQLQFWTESSALHMAAVSKKHCLGFYDVMAFVSEDDWKQSSSEEVSDEALPMKWLKKIVGMSNPVQNRRDLVAVLQIKYKWDGHVHNKLFYDEEAIDLP
jgi:hypothetical protein